MTTLGLSMKVSRAHVGAGLPDLELQDFDGGFDVMSAGPGPDMMRLITATSDMHDGSVLVGYVYDDTTAPLKVRVYGDDQADLETKIDVLRQAFRQWHFTLTETRGNFSRVWTCKPSVVVEGNGGVWDPTLLGLHWQDVAIALTREPF